MNNLLDYAFSGLRVVRLVNIYRSILLASIVLLSGATPSQARAASAAPPVLISEQTSTRAIALDASTLTKEPFPLAAPVNFGADGRTRVMLFANNLTLLPGEDASVVTAEAEDGSHQRYPLNVEYVGPVPDLNSVTQVILRALKTYGMILADNGSNWYVSGAPDSRWNDDELNTLKTVKGSDFEVVQMGAIVTH